MDDNGLTTPSAPTDEIVNVALRCFGRGDPVMVVDPQGACTVVLAAELASAERVAQLVRISTGVVNVCLDESHMQAFGFHPIAHTGHNLGRHSPYLSVDYVGAGTPGPSAKDRAATLRSLCNKDNLPSAYSSPGHCVPLRTATGGILELDGCAEAAYDMCRLGGLRPVAALVQPMTQDGDLLGEEGAAEFARQHSLPVVSVRSLCDYRQASGALGQVLKNAGPTLETESKMWIDEIREECSIRVYSTSDPKVEIVAITNGDLQGKEDVPVRIHSECFTGDVLASQRCDCGQQLHKFLAVMDQSQAGVLLYIRGHEGRGIGLPNKIRAYKLQDQGYDTVDANVRLGLPVDARTYDDPLAVLKDLGVSTIKLFTNNPEKISALKPITNSVAAMGSTPCARNQKYLDTKKARLNHRTVLETFQLPTPHLMPSLRIGIVFTTWNEYFVNELVGLADGTLQKKAVKTQRLSVPGACDLVSGARALLRQGKPDAIIVIGVLIKGASDIYDATCSSVMNGLTDLNATQDVPVILGLLMCHDEDQARERSCGPNNPAKAWAETAMHMATLSSQIQPPPVSPNPSAPRTPAVRSPA